jgi:hypothetical protein
VATLLIGAAPPTSARAASTNYCADVSLHLLLDGEGGIEGSGACSFGTDAAMLSFAGSSRTQVDCLADPHGKFTMTGTLTARKPDGSTAFITDFTVQQLAWLPPDIFGRYNHGTATASFGDATAGPATFDIGWRFFGGIGLGATAADLCYWDNYTEMRSFDISADALLPTAGPPVSTDDPRVSGSARVGSTLTTTTGAWLGGPTEYDYQWQRCEAEGLPCNDIQGAWAGSYVPVAADAGHPLRAKVTACNVNGCGVPAMSAPTDPVAP